MDLGQWIVIGLSALFGVWFGVGTFLNRRRGIETYRWLQGGLKSLGKISEAAWIGSAGSGARLVVGNADSPFRRIEVIFLLESREILPLWLFNRFRNKKDEMILKASLRNPPLQEVELFRESDRQAASGLGKPENQTVEFTQTRQGFRLARRGREDAQILEQLNAFIEEYPDAVRSMSIQRKSPQLMVRVDLPPLRQSTGEAFFESLRQALKQ